jgi:hypothetical protein
MRWLNAMRSPVLVLGGICQSARQTCRSAMNHDGGSGEIGQVAERIALTSPVDRGVTIESEAGVGTAWHGSQKGGRGRPLHSGGCMKEHRPQIFLLAYQTAMLPNSCHTMQSEGCGGPSSCKLAVHNSAPTEYAALFCEA